VASGGLRDGTRGQQPAAGYAARPCAGPFGRGDEELKRLLVDLAVGVLLIPSVACAVPMLVTTASRDVNGDGKLDRIAIWLTEGRRYDDTELWGGAGEKYEGRFVVLVEITGKMPVTNDLNRLFYPEYEGKEPMFFRCSKPLEMQFADYNHDGLLDFNLGQYAGTAAGCFRLFTVSRDGRVSELSVDGQPSGFGGPLRTHSTSLIAATREGFTHSYYSRMIGTEIRSWYRWDKDKIMFVLVKQEPPDRRPEPEVGTYRR